MIELTERAVKKVTELTGQQTDSELRLRIFVSEGGCSGMEYGMKFDSPSESDLRIGDDRCEVLVDPDSMKQIEGSIVDFDDGLNGTGFSVRNPHAKETCGCGRSFS